MGTLAVGTKTLVFMVLEGFNIPNAVTLSSQPMIPPKRFDIFPPDWEMLRRSRCVQIFLETTTTVVVVSFRNVVFCCTSVWAIVFLVHRQGLNTLVAGGRRVKTIIRNYAMLSSKDL